jgi:hypothetical protein
LVAEELSGHLPPGGQRLGLTLVQRGGRGARRGGQAGQLQTGQLGQRLRLLLIIAATNENAKAGHLSSSGNAREYQRHCRHYPSLRRLPTTAATIPSAYAR